MPFRFRKSISLGKGFRLNLSKGGISSTFGVKGLHLNVGKRGVRPTVGVPGTGMSFTPSTAQAKTQSNGTGGYLKNIIIFTISAFLLCIICLCVYGLFFLDSGDATPTATPTIFAPGTAIIQTSNAAVLQTKAASSPTANVTSTFLPSLTPAATLAVIDTLVPPLASTIILPTNQPTATHAIIVFPTNTKRPSGGGGSGACSCSSDTYNCGDFSSHASAQACFDYCVQQGKGDIHKLDRDNDGLACEG
jgi:hypothetical protein